MKDLLFNEFIAVYFILVLLTHFLIRRGRRDFITTRKISFLILAVTSAVASVAFLFYCILITHWWMLICLVNMSILAVIFIDGILLKLIRSLLSAYKRPAF
jgi:uncharacterized membrane protein